MTKDMQGNRPLRCRELTDRQNLPAATNSGSAKDTPQKSKEVIPISGYSRKKKTMAEVRDAVRLRFLRLRNVSPNPSHWPFPLRGGTLHIGLAIPRLAFPHLHSIPFFCTRSSETRSVKGTGGELGDRARFGGTCIKPGSGDPYRSWSRLWTRPAWVCDPPRSEGLP